MVEQLGLATMPLGIDLSAPGLTSGTTRGTSGSIRQALELSMTMAPALAAIGLLSRLTDAGVLERTICTPANASGEIGSIAYFLPLNSMLLPALRDDARNLTDAKGNLRSIKTWRMTSPTAPVAPTTATWTDIEVVLSRSVKVQKTVESLSLTIRRLASSHSFRGR